MKKRLFLLLLLVNLSLGWISASLALDKVQVGTSVKVYSGYYLPVMAAEEKGFWKENGLEAEWVPFQGSAPMLAAAAAGSLNIGLMPGVAPIMGAERGAPIVMVAELISSEPFMVWVRSATPYRHPRELKGGKISVTRLGGPGHIFGQLVAKAYGIEKDVRFIGAGGIPEELAAIKAGATDGMVEPMSVVIKLKVDGTIREIASLADYYPKPWVEHVLMARKDFMRGKPEITRRTIKATLQATDFLNKNPRWALDKMKSVEGLSDEAAKMVLDAVKFTTAGRLDRKAVENVRNLFIEYGLLSKEKTPAVDDLFTNDYLP